MVAVLERTGVQEKGANLRSGGQMNNEAIIAYLVGFGCGTLFGLLTYWAAVAKTKDKVKG
jgi:hypothetical protein